MNNERIEELLALAALGELDAAQEAELDRALADDAELAAEFDADQDTVAFLQLGVAEAPPADLRAGVLGAIADVEQEPAVPAVTEAPESVVSLDAERRRRRPIAQLLVGAAAIVAVVIAGTTLIDRRADAPTFADIVDSSDADTRALDGPIDGDLRVVYSPSSDGFVLEGASVAGVADDQTYQLWLVDDSGATPIGTFQPDEDGQVAEIYDGIDPTEFTVGVTIEPAGGSDTPTLPIVASG